MSDMVERPTLVEFEFEGKSVSAEMVNNIPIFTITGEVSHKQQLIYMYQELLQRTGVMPEPEKYLIRNVRKNRTELVVSSGCERDDGSYRDRRLERDFNLDSDDYTYCHSFNGDKQEYLEHATYSPDRMDLVVYRAGEMILHGEEEYDKASSLGGEATAVTYEFKNKNRKSDAVYMVVKSNLNDLSSRK